MRAYTKEEVVQKLKDLYSTHGCPLNFSMVQREKGMPDIHVYQRLFGSLNAACKEAEVPFEKAKPTKSSSEIQLNKQLRIEREGQQRTNGQGYLMTCISYDGYDCVKVQFADPQKTTIITSWKQFDKGTTENPNYYASRVGEENHNKQGCLMKIVEYVDNEHYVVEFQDKFAYKTKVKYRSFKDGSIRNPFAPTCCSVGIVGIKYSTKDKKTGKSTKEYNTWRKMIERCFDERRQKRDKTYENVSICEEWLYYPDFVEWLHKQENFGFWNSNKNAQIDKDILSGTKNKIYSPETCLLVPSNINNIFKETTRPKNTGLPIGVERSGKKYRVIYCHKKFGTYKTIEEAFQVYKTYKESHIKEMAEREYQKGTISKKCYDAMMQYKIEITD